MDLEQTKEQVWYYNIHDYDDYTERKIEGREEIVDRIQDKIDELDGCELLFTSGEIIKMLDEIVYGVN